MIMAQGTPLSEAQSPNALWCADYKGELTLGNNLLSIELHPPVSVRDSYAGKTWPEPEWFHLDEKS